MVNMDGKCIKGLRERRRVKSVGFRVGTLNVGMITGKGGELAGMMKRRKAGVL